MLALSCGLVWDTVNVNGMLALTTALSVDVSANKDQNSLSLGSALPHRKPSFFSLDLKEAEFHKRGTR